VPTRNVRLTEHQAELIDGLVRSGRYQNASEVIREGLRIVEEREAAQAETLEWFNAQIAPGVEQALAREFVGDLDEVFARMDETIANLDPDEE
jgi:antitoxin ParD1/3/4